MTCCGNSAWPMPLLTCMLPYLTLTAPQQMSGCADTATLAASKKSWAVPINNTAPDMHTAGQCSPLSNHNVLRTAQSRWPHCYNVLHAASRTRCAAFLCVHLQEATSTLDSCNAHRSERMAASICFLHAASGTTCAARRPRRPAAASSLAAQWPGDTSAADTPARVRSNAATAAPNASRPTRVRSGSAATTCRAMGWLDLLNCCGMLIF